MASFRFGRRLPRWSLVAALVVAAAADLIFGAIPGADAHGGPPRTRLVAFHPTNPDVWMSQTSFGLVRTDDGGGTWRWICPQAMDWDVGENPTFILTEDGSTVGALFGGLTRSDADWCDWSFPEPALEQSVVIDVARDPAAPNRVLVVTSNGSSDNAVFGSDDEGRTWSQRGPFLGRVLFESIGFAPGEATEAYLAGVSLPRGNPEDPDYEPRRAFVYRSGDGGETFPEARRKEIPLGVEDRAVALVGVSPVDPDVFFVHVVARDADDQIRRTTDGGDTFETVLLTTQLFSFAVSEDGTKAWASGLDLGLRFSDDGGETFTILDQDFDTRCLTARAGDGLYACGNDTTHGFAIGRSADDGRSFETVFRHADLGGPVPCAADSRTADVCAAWTRDVCDDLEIEASWCNEGSGNTRDAGPPVRGSAGGCAVGGRAAPGPGTGWPLFLTLLGIGTRGARALRGRPRGAGASRARPDPEPRPR